MCVRAKAPASFFSRSLSLSVCCVEMCDACDLEGVLRQIDIEILPAFILTFPYIATYRSFSCCHWFWQALNKSAYEANCLWCVRYDNGFHRPPVFSAQKNHRSKNWFNFASTAITSHGGMRAILVVVSNDKLVKSKRISIGMLQFRYLPPK